MAQVLIVYATREGQTEKVARRLADVLRSGGYAVQAVDAEHLPSGLDLGRFAAVFVGSPVRSGGYLRSIIRFIRAHRQALERIPSAFFSVGLAVASKTHDGRAQTRRLVEEFVRRTGWRPRRVELVAGALPYSKYNFLLRFVMRRIAANEGGDTDTSRDYEYTDWKSVEAFASGFVSEAIPVVRTGHSAAVSSVAGSLVI